MKGRTPFAVALAMLVLLFAVNLVVFMWGEGQRARGLDELERAMRRQLLAASVKQRLNDLSREMALLGEVHAESTGGRRSADDLSRFEARLASVRAQLLEARELTAAPAVADLSELARAYEDLAASWRTAYEALGVDNAKAIKELSLHAEPLTQTVISGLLREWEAREQARAEAARNAVGQVERLVRRFTLMAMAGSLAAAMVIAALLWRWLGAVAAA